jgi:hypothetical protein
MNASFREQVHLYCEGLLPEYAETALFAELATNSGLRTEMTELLKLQSAVKSHAASIRPQHGAKNALFAELGLSLPESAAASVAGAVVQQAAGTGAALSIKSALFALGLSLFSSLATAIAVLFFLQTGWWQSGNTFFSGATPPPSQASSSLASEPERYYAMPHDTLRKTTTIVRYIPVAQSPQVALQNTSLMGNDDHLKAEGSTATQMESESINGSEQSSLSVEAHSVEEQTHSQALPPSQETTLIQQNTATPEQFATEKTLTDRKNASIFNRPKLGIIVGVRGVRSRSLPEATVEANSYPLFNHTAFSLMLPLSPTSALGVEAGQEAYFLRYRTILPEQEGVVGIEKNPVLMWAGITYKHTFLPNDLFSPVLNLTLGGTSVGAMGRTLLGVQYSIDTKTRCTLGVEASSLLYIHREVWNFSPNVGISYGISFEL